MSDAARPVMQIADDDLHPLCRRDLETAARCRLDRGDALSCVLSQTVEAWPIGPSGHYVKRVYRTRGGRLLTAVTPYHGAAGESRCAKLLTGPS